MLFSKYLLNFREQMVQRERFTQARNPECQDIFATIAVVSGHQENGSEGHKGEEMLRHS